MAFPPGTWSAVTGHDSHQAEREVLRVTVAAVGAGPRVRVEVGFGADELPEAELAWREAPVSAVTEDGDALVVDGRFQAHPVTATQLRLSLERRADRWTAKATPVLVLRAGDTEVLLRATAAPGPEAS